MERYPNLKEEVGGSNPGCEISSLPGGNLSGGQLPHVLWCLHVGLLSQERKERKGNFQCHSIIFSDAGQSPRTHMLLVTNWAVI